MTDRAVFSTFLGDVEIIVENDQLRKVLILDKPIGKIMPRSVFGKEAMRQLEEYFSGKRRVFDLSYHIEGTDFFRKVLNELALVPYGDTISYSDLAERAGYPKAGRAVGSVMRKNPLPILIPCHRVILANGDIGSFTGGVELKRMLLEHEKHNREG